MRLYFNNSPPGSLSDFTVGLWLTKGKVKRVILLITEENWLPSITIRHLEIARETGSRWLSRYIVGLFYGTHFSYGGKFIPQKRRTMRFDNHFDPVSRATLTWRINHTCLMAVRNPWGLKKPVIQNTLGLPSKHQFLNWLFLSKSSVYQNPSVEDSHEI